jgi:3-deoxy-manno-octulosonate cytidylyltransferase (CMP-KDO synthetase)
MLTLVGGTDMPQHAAEVALIIPARQASRRFPGKPLIPLRGSKGLAKSLIQRSWEAARAVEGVADIRIATDDLRIAEAAATFGAEVILISSACRNATECCWEAVETAGLTAEIIVNLPGDAPLIPPLAIEALIGTMHANPALRVGSSMIRCSPLRLARLLCDARTSRSNDTTVVFDQAMNALYFSKTVIPHVPEQNTDVPVFLHMGLYAYRRHALADYAERSPAPLELVEGLEQLRFLQAGIPIRMIEVADPPGGLWDLNSPADVVTVEAALAERRIL